MMLDNVGTWLSHPVIQQIGWVLVHFIWQGAVVAGLLAGALALVRQGQAQLRYAIGLVALVALLMMPVATWALLPVDAPSGAAPTAQMPAVSQHPSLLIALMPPPEAASTSWAATLQSAIAAGLPWLVAGWLGGVLVLGGRLLGGWIYATRLRRRHAHPVCKALQQRADALAARLGIRHAIRVCQTAQVDVPMVMGWLRPLVLVPAGVLTGLPPGQVDALIAHELSHIQRHDVLVGWVQVAAETLLFYHPAVWWISRQVRIEREHCCDDLAIAACCDRLDYARALTTLAAQRGPQPAGALAAADGSLLARIRRLIEPSNVTSSRDRRTAAMALAVVATVLVAVGACASQQAASTETMDPEPEPTTTQAAEPAAQGAASAQTAMPGADTSEVEDAQVAYAAPDARERTRVHIVPAPNGAHDVRVHRAQTDSNGTVTVWVEPDHERLWSHLDSLEGLDSLIDRDVQVYLERALAMGDALPDPPMPDWPPAFPRDSLDVVFPDVSFPDIDIPDIDIERFHALDSLYVPHPPGPPPIFFMEHDTIDLGAFQRQLSDSLRALLPRFRSLPDSLEQARIDSLRQRIQRQMRVHQERMRRLAEDHQERIEHLHREIRERQLEGKSQRLRDQAEALRRQAERLEEQAREMERQRAPATDTTAVDSLQGALPIDAAPLAALRAGSPAAHRQADDSDTTSPGWAIYAAHPERSEWRSPSERQAVARSVIHTVTGSDRVRLAALSVVRQSVAPDVEAPRQHTAWTSPRPAASPRPAVRRVIETNQSLPNK